MTPRQRLRAELVAWAARWARDGDDPADASRRQALGRALFAMQYETMPLYQRACARAGVTPATLGAIEDAPTLPVTALKRRVIASPEALAATAPIRFATSGTTDGSPGRVLLADAQAYDASLHAGFARRVLADRPSGGPGRDEDRFVVVSLVPDGALRPESSLGHMVRAVAARWALGPLRVVLQPADDATDTGRLDLQVLADAVARARAAGVPVLILATTIALGQLVEALRADPARRAACALPPGSRLMDTGGPKGRRLRVDRDAQHRWLEAELGLGPAQIVGELGMTELGSQLYEVAGLRGRYHPPPWLRVVVRDPSTGDRCPAGVQGVVCYVDLANLDTPAFVMTGDVGHLEDGPHGPALVLGGRLPRAEWRGCGLDAEDLLVGPA